MAFLKTSNTKIVGMAAAVPKEVETIESLSCLKPGESDKISIVTGIIERRIAPEGKVCSDYCIEAAKQLIPVLGWEKNSIDLIVYAPISRDYNEPNTSNLIQSALGLSQECIAFDMPNACSGFVYGMSVCASMLQSGCIKRALLFAGDTQSKMVSRLDKTLWPITGDAATVTALEYDPEAPDLNFLLRGDGESYEALIAPASGVREYPTAESFEYETVADGITRTRNQIQMDGMTVFNFAIREPYKAIMDLCEKVSFDIQNADYLLIHQANRLIDEKIRKKLKIPESKVPYSLDEFGNSSSGTIPLTMVTRITEPLRNETLNLVLCGFGAGLSWGACIMQTQNVTVLPLIEI